MLVPLAISFSNKSNLLKILLVNRVRCWGAVDIRDKLSQGSRRSWRDVKKWFLTGTIPGPTSCLKVTDENHRKSPLVSQKLFFQSFGADRCLCSTHGVCQRSSRFGSVSYRPQASQINTINTCLSITATSLTATAVWGNNNRCLLQPWCGPGVISDLCHFLIKCLNLWIGLISNKKN